MPDDETITSFADRIIELTERVIADHGGRRTFEDSRVIYRIPAQKPANTTPLADLTNQIETLQNKLKSDITSDILQENDPIKLARSAYLAICLDLAPALKETHPDQWHKALNALETNSNVIQVLFYHSPVPLAESLRQKAQAAGLKKPLKQEKIW